MSLYVTGSTSGFPAASLSFCPVDRSRQTGGCWGPRAAGEPGAVELPALDLETPWNRYPGSSHVRAPPNSTPNKATL